LTEAFFIAKPMKNSAYVTTFNICTSEIFTPLLTSLCTEALSFEGKQRGERRYSISPWVMFDAFLFNASTLQYLSGIGQRLTLAHCPHVAHLCKTVWRLCRPHTLLFNRYWGKAAGEWSRPLSTN